MHITKDFLPQAVVAEIENLIYPATLEEKIEEWIIESEAYIKAFVDISKVEETQIELMNKLYIQKRAYEVSNEYEIAETNSERLDNMLGAIRTAQRKIEETALEYGYKPCATIEPKETVFDNEEFWK